MYSCGGNTKSIRSMYALTGNYYIFVILRTPENGTIKTDNLCTLIF